MDGNDEIGNAGGSANSPPTISFNQGVAESPKSNRSGRFSSKFLGFLRRGISWLDSHNGVTTAVATVVMAIFTGLLAEYAKEQGAITERQLEITKRQIDAAERPWLSIQFAPTSDLSFEQGLGQIGIKITLKNTGHTPAAGIQIEAEGYFPDTVQDILQRQKGICRQYSSPDFGSTVFPGETADFEIPVYFLDEDVKNGKAPLKDFGFFRNPTIGVCVSYRFPFDDPKEEHDRIVETHRTGAAWQLFRKPNFARIVPDKKVPLKEIGMNNRSRLSFGEQAN